MISKELSDYIKTTRAQGFSDEQIRSALIEAGWEVDEIEEGLNPQLDRPKTKAASEPKKASAFLSRYKKLLLISLIVIVVIPALSYAGLLLYQNYQQNRQERLAAENERLEEQKRIAEEEQKIAEERKLAASLLRDEQRISDISSIQIALASFSEQNSAYPTRLEQLVEAQLLTQVPFDPDPNKVYLYTPLGDPVSHYTVSFILENRVGPLDAGLQVFTSENLLNAEEVLTQEQTVKGAVTAVNPNGLLLTDLSQTAFSPGEEVSVQLSRSDGGELSYAVLSLANLRLTDTLNPFSFRFSAPKQPGSYTIQLVGFDENGTSFSGRTTLTIK